MSQVAAAGGARGMGTAAIAKVLALCAGTAGGAAVCMSAGVVPAPLGLTPDEAVRPHVERVAGPLRRQAEPEQVATPAAEPEAEPVVEAPPPETVATATAPQVASSAEVAATEAAPSPPPEPAPVSSPPATAASTGSVAGEFGP
jgi:hypothetical protein